MQNAHEIAYLGHMVVLSGNAKRTTKLAKQNSNFHKKLETAIHAAHLVRGFTSQREVVLIQN